MRFHPSIHLPLMLFTLALVWTDEPLAQGRTSTAPLKHVPSSGYGSAKVGDAVQGELQSGPDTATMCKDVKAVIKAASRNFEPLRGATKPSKGDATVWESRKSIQEFSNCAVYQAPSLGDYVMCMNKSTCAASKDNFHLLSAALMSCLKNWNWQDGRVSGYRDYERTVSATNEDGGIRVSLELTPSQSYYSGPDARCDTMLSIELPSL